MTEYLLYTKIFREAEPTLTAQTGDNSYLVILFCIAIISAIILFKKKAVKIMLAFVLMVRVTIALPLAYNDRLISILLEAVGIAEGVTYSHIWTSYYLLSSEGNYNVN